MSITSKSAAEAAAKAIQEMLSRKAVKVGSSAKGVKADRKRSARRSR